MVVEPRQGERRGGAAGEQQWADAGGCMLQEAASGDRLVVHSTCPAACSDQCVNCRRLHAMQQTLVWAAVVLAKCQA